MNNEDLQKLKAAATAVENHGVIRSMALPTSEILALIAEAEQARAENGDRQALEKVAEALQQFKRDWMAVPVFADRVNKSTRDAISRAIGPLVNLDAVGGPLDLSKHK